MQRLFIGQKGLVLGLRFRLQQRRLALPCLRVLWCSWEISGLLGGSSEVGVAGTDVVNKPMTAKVQVETNFNKNSIGVGKTLYNASVQFSGGVKQAREYVTLAAESLTNTDLYTARKVADYIRTLHPSLIPFASEYPMMARLSEYTASWVYCNELDKSTLSLNGWGERSGAKAVRRCLEGKIRSERSMMISRSYDLTNKLLYDCLSKEFKDNSGGVDSVVELGAAHGLHLAGDVKFRRNHMSSAKMEFRMIWIWGLWYFGRILRSVTLMV